MAFKTGDLSLTSLQLSVDMYDAQILCINVYNEVGRQKRYYSPTPKHTHAHSKTYLSRSCFSRFSILAITSRHFLSSPCRWVTSCRKFSVAPPGSEEATVCDEAPWWPDPGLLGMLWGAELSAGMLEIEEDFTAPLGTDLVAHNKTQNNFTFAGTVCIWYTSTCSYMCIKHA